MFSAKYQAFAQRAEVSWSLDEVRYRSPEGHLLEVSQDLAALQQWSGSRWRDLFDQRAGARGYPDRSGVWGKREWVLPELDLEDMVSLGEGQTQLLEVPRLAKAMGLTRASGLAIKQCGHTHTGSFKDWGMTVLVSQVKRMRRLGVPISAIGCASTGDTSAALSAYAAYAGIPAVVFLPADKISLAQLVQPIANGALVLSLDTDFDGCMRLIQEVVAATPIYLANSMNSLRIEGQKTIAIEITQQRHWSVPDVVVVPGGNLGNVYALYKGFAEMKTLGLTERLPRLVVAQAEAASPLAKAWQKAQAQGGLAALKDCYQPEVPTSTIASAIRIGDPVSIDRAILALQATHGVAASASEGELIEACAKADRMGLFTCPHTGVALAVTERLIRQGHIGADEEVVVVSTAHGLKFTDSKVRYHAGELAHLGEQQRWRNPPMSLPAQLGPVMDALHARLGLAL